MSEDTTDAGDEEAPTELDASAVAELAEQERREQKALRFETDAGVAEYTYQMVREGKLSELSEKHFETPDVRGGRADDLDVDADSYEKFRAEVIREGLVDGPEGTKTTLQWIRKNIPDDWQAELFDAITDFSSMDEAEYRQFR